MTRIRAVQTQHNKHERFQDLHGLRRLHDMETISIIDYRINVREYVLDENQYYFVHFGEVLLSYHCDPS